MKIIVETSYLKHEHIDTLKQTFPHHIFTEDLNDMSAEAMISMPKYIQKEVLNHLPKIKWIFVLTAGYDTIDLEDLKERNIILYHAKDVFSIQIAEDTIGKMISFNRHFMTYYDQMKLGLWKYHKVYYEIAHSTIGIIGTGSIGYEIAKRLKAFDTHIMGYRRKNEDIPFFDEIVTNEEGLNRLIQTSDYIILSIPLDSKTYHLFNEEKFKLMKKSAVLINVARGDIVDQDALVDALNKEQIRGALLDVTSPEPLPFNHRLWSAKHVMITPHQASSSPYVLDRLNNVLIQTLTAIDQNLKIFNQVL